MLSDRYPYYLANRPLQPNADLEVGDKYRGHTATRVALADAAALEQGIAAAAAAVPAMREWPPYERQAALAHCAQRFDDRREELAQALCIEAGKPIRDSRGEVTRLIDTFRIAAEEAVRLDGAVMNLETGPRSRGYRGQYRRVPIGACAFISPFNFPLNLAAHKIAPAIAAGCPFVLKPASRTPVGALLIGEALAETALPAGAFSILPCRREVAERLVADERLRLLSFTGSAAVGWPMKGRAGKKKVVLELGGNAACIVHADADLDDAVERLTFGVFYQSGQSCISVQRILIHEDVYESCREKLIAAAEKLACGDPSDESVSIGPLIDEREAKRLEAWIEEAREAGAQLLCGGRRNGAMLQPTLLEDVPPTLALCTEEAFGPVAVLERYRRFADALERANDSAYGLQAGVFTRDLYHALEAWDRLEVGSVIVGDVPSWRADHMPYGGVKDSGQGREGVRFAMESMSEIRNLVIRTP